MANLDPGEENHDGQSRVEDHLPVAETLEVTVLVWVGETLEVTVLVGVGEQLLEDGVDLHGAVDVEDDAANSHDDDDDVQDVPEGLQIRQSQLLDLLTQANNQWRI